MATATAKTEVKTFIKEISVTELVIEEVTLVMSLEEANFLRRLVGYFGGTGLARKHADVIHTALQSHTTSHYRSGHGHTEYVIQNIDTNLQYNKNYKD